MDIFILYFALKCERQDDTIDLINIGLNTGVMQVMSRTCLMLMFAGFKGWIFGYFPHTLLITKIKWRWKFNSGSSSRDTIYSKAFFSIAKGDLIILNWKKAWIFVSKINEAIILQITFDSTYKAISSSLISLTSHPQFGSPSHAGPPMAPSNLQYAPVHS